MNLRRLFEQLRVPTKSHGEHKNVRRGWVAICCPCCGDSSQFYLAFPERGGTGGNCWRCGRHSLWDVLIALGLDRRQAAEAMAGLDLQRLPKTDTPFPGRYRPPKGVGLLGGKHLAYLRNRGISEARAASWGIKGIGLSARLAWSLFLPVVLHGAELSWTTRSVGKGGRRYVSARPEEEAAPLKTLLYGEDFARNSVVVVEGPMDAVRIGPGAAATFGLNTTAAQVAKIAGFPLRAICFDNEPRAQAAAERLCRDLAAFPGETVRVVIESGKDAGEADEEEILEIRRMFLDG